MDFPFLLVLPILVGVIFCLISIPKWISKCRKSGLLWEDMNKYGRPKNVASSGGVVVVISFILAILTYVALRTFVYGTQDYINTEIFALLVVISLLAIIGLVDDLLGWHRGGLSPKIRIFLALIAAIPLIVINAGQSFITLPFFGSVDFGLIYPLVLIPLGIAATTTVYNFLAGFNGLEAGQGILILTFFSYISYLNGASWLSIIGLAMVFCLMVFWFYNKNPARVFGGDILTYSVGALIGAMAILGNFEKVAIIVFIPYILEMILKSSGRLKKQSFGKPQKDGSLEMPYEKIYGLTHLSLFILKKLKKKVYENDVVYFIHIIQIIFILIAFATI